MAGNGERQGQRDAEQGRPAAPQGTKTWAEHQNYLKGYGNGSQKK